MCVRFEGHWFVTETPITAYKKVAILNNKDHITQYGKFSSFYKANGRVPQYRESTGKEVIYELGKEVKSAPPGLYCYMYKDDAIPHLLTSPWAVLEVTIPVGTKIRYGKDKDDTPTINALKVIPKAVYKHGQ